MLSHTNTLYRFRTAARILRLGYNMMFLDTDLIIFDDPYKWVNGDGLMGGDPYKGWVGER